MAYSFAVVSLMPIPAPRPGDRPPDALRYPGIEQTPAPGDKLKFQPADGQPLAVPGLYLVIGKSETGLYKDNRGENQLWRRITGTALPIALGDAEKTLAAMLAKLPSK